MSKTRDRILVITDLLLGAAHADSRLDGSERAAVRKLLQEVLGVEKLPPEVESRIEEFTGDDFDLEASAREFSIDPPVQKRELLELVAKVHEADGELDLAEDEYLVNLAQTLNLPEADYKDLALVVEVEELRSSMARLRPPPVPPPRDRSVDVDGDPDDGVR